MKELRQFLASNVDLQAQFMVARLQMRSRKCSKKPRLLIARKRPAAI